MTRSIENFGRRRPRRVPPTALDGRCRHRETRRVRQFDGPSIGKNRSAAAYAGDVAARRAEAKRIMIITRPPVSAIVLPRRIFFSADRTADRPRTLSSVDDLISYIF